MIPVIPGIATLTLTAAALPALAITTRNPRLFAGAVIAGAALVAVAFGITLGTVLGAETAYAIVGGALLGCLALLAIEIYPRLHMSVRVWAVNWTNGH